MRTVADLFEDPQLAARGMLLPVSGGGGLKVPGSPLKFAGAPPERTRPPAPALGEHTGEVLAELAAAAGDGQGGDGPGGASPAAGGGPA